MWKIAPFYYHEMAFRLVTPELIENLFVVFQFTESKVYYRSNNNKKNINVGISKKN